MDSNFSKPRYMIIITMVILAGLVRFIPHPPNFAPIAALALFGGRYVNNKKFAFFIPVVIMLLTDYILGFHYLMPAVYLSFMLIVGIGILLRKTNKIAWLIAGSIAASTLFFIITNFYEWFVGILYSKTLIGLGTCFVAAIPFFFNTLLGDLFYVVLMFMSFELLNHKVQELVKV